MYCINATCFHGCEMEEECLATENCQNGICRPDPTPGPECYLNSDCEAECDICVNGQCLAI